MGKPMTLAEFIERGNEIHEGKYGYDKVVEYKNSRTKVPIYCLPCDAYFPQRPDNHLAGKGCPCCAKKIKIQTLKQANEESNQKGAQEFKSKGNEIHECKYGYDKVVYKNNSTKVPIYCPPCDAYFPQRPCDHLAGQGCPNCAKKIKIQVGKQAAEERHQKAAQEFEPKFRKIHGDKYEYLSPYIASYVHMDMRCKETGELFQQTPNIHLRGHGCPCCVNKTEGIVRDALNEILSPYGLKATITGNKETKGIGKMDITIHMDDGKIVGFVEVDGIQHFKDAKWFKTKAIDVQNQDLKKHMNAINNEYWVIRIDQEWALNSHNKGNTKWIERLTETILKLVGNVKPSIDDMFLINKKDKYHEHLCYQYEQNVSNVI